MAAPGVGMVTSVSFIGTCNAQRIMNTIHYRMNVAWTQGTVSAYYTAFFNQIKPAGAFDICTTFLDMLSNHYTLDDLRIQVIHPVRYRSALFHIGAAGAVNDGCSAQNVCLSIEKFTEFSGRSQVGRIHVGGLGTSGYADGFVAGATRIKAAIWTDKLFLPVFEDQGPGDNRPVIYHPKPNTQTKTNDIVGFNVKDTLRTQRTRNIGKGE